jgi:hypothetical protein
MFPELSSAMAVGSAPIASPARKLHTHSLHATPSQFSSPSFVQSSAVAFGVTSGTQAS